MHRQVRAGQALPRPKNVCMVRISGTRAYSRHIFARENSFVAVAGVHWLTFSIELECFVVTQRRIHLHNLTLSLWCAYV